MSGESDDEGTGRKVEDCHCLAYSFGTQRFAEIRDLLPGLSEKVVHSCDGSKKTACCTAT
jgi:hypothetical protein